MSSRSGWWPRRFLGTFLVSRRVAKKLLLPRFNRPAAERVYPEHAPFLYVEHFPAVFPQLILDADRQDAALRLERPGVGILVVPGIIPGLEIIKQPAR